MGLGYSFIGLLAWANSKEIVVRNNAMKSIIVAYGLLFGGVGLTIIC